MSVVSFTLSCVWPSFSSFRFFSTRSASCSVRIRAFAIIPFMEYDVGFPSILVNSLILGLLEDGTLITTQSVALPEIALFFLRICSSVPSSPSVCVKKNCSSSPTTQEDVVNSMGVVCISFWTLKRIFSVTFSSNLEKSQLLCWLNQRYVLFYSWTVVHSHMRSTKIVE